MTFLKCNFIEFRLVRSEKLLVAGGIKSLCICDGLGVVDVEALRLACEGRVACTAIETAGRSIWWYGEGPHPRCLQAGYKHSTEMAAGLLVDIGLKIALKYCESM